jgi:hypothetical protein
VQGEVVGVIEAGRITFLVEVKYVKSALDPSGLDDWLTGLLKIGQKFGAERLVFYLALVVFDKALFESVKISPHLLSAAVNSQMAHQSKN